MWKLNMEKSTNNSYVFKSKVSSTAGEIIYYYCNRSQTKEMFRLSKSQELCKMNNMCTSTIRVVNENNKIVVEWLKTHYGHCNEPQHIRLRHVRLPDLEKQNIAAKLTSGVAPKRILESVRNGLGEDLNRIDLLTPKDITNIKKMEWNKWTE
ncbi:hypothetical protein ABEB36_000329 [Hypothenemus hampei]|uniref:FLYWCH-type domain-containing protein n=1 Tax=Hypothenemus hampei TaxID=57062 RepID=A0ABD1FAX9_HYPHA